MYQPKNLEGFLKIFTFETKRELKRYCRGVVVHQSDFVAFILACDRGDMPFVHRIHYRETVPDHLVPSEPGLKALATNGVGLLKGEAVKTVRKVFQLFDERRCLVGHLFHTPSLHEWHFFCFDQRDVNEDSRNHWKKGSHVHFVNWLWPDQDCQSVWSSFVAGDYRPERSLHLRFKPGAA